MSESIDFIFKLIHCVKKYNEIWDKTYSVSNKKKLIEKAWNEISEELGRPVSDCKAKWRNYRQYYIRKHKECAEGVIPSHRSRRSRNLMNELEFLGPQAILKSRKSKKSSNTTPIIEISDEEDGLTRTSHFMGSQFNDTNDIENNEVVFDDDTTVVTEGKYGSGSQPNVISSTLPRFSRTFSVNDIVSTNYGAESTHQRRRSRANQIDQEISNIINQHNHDDHPMMLFFKSVLPDLVPLPSKKQRLFKKNVLDIIDKLHNDVENSDE